MISLQTALAMMCGSVVGGIIVIAIANIFFKAKDDRSI
jgi:hypothetical protein